jgi:hypothetical protein
LRVNCGFSVKKLYRMISKSQWIFESIVS